MKDLMELLEQKRKESGIQDVKQPQSLNNKIANKIDKIIKNSKYEIRPVVSKAVINIKNIVIIEGKERNTAPNEPTHHDESLEFWRNYEAKKRINQKKELSKEFEEGLKLWMGSGFNSQKFKILFEFIYDFDIFNKLEKTRQFIDHFFSDSFLSIFTLLLGNGDDNDETFLHSIRTEENRILLI